ncbi:MAG: hypothetical protein ABSB19_09440 [Methylomonas sp.]
MNPSISQGSVIFYTTPSSFATAEPGLPAQGFSGANLFNQPYVDQANFLSSTTNDAVFPLGSILPGLTISTLNPGLASNALVVYAGAIGNNWFGDTLEMSFAPGVSAVAENYFASVAGQSPIATSFTENVYDGATLLASNTFNGAANYTNFFGVSSTTQITKITIANNYDSDASTFVGNIAFGPTQAPLPSPFWMFSSIIAVLIGMTGRRR